MKAFGWKTALIGCGILLLGSNIARSVLADSPAVVRESDRRDARRNVHPSCGSDPRLAAPPGRSVGGNGVIEPKGREIRVAANVPGVISRIAVSEGDAVEAGAILVELDTSVETATLETAEADVRAANAELVRTVRGNRREDVQAALAEAQAAQAQAQLSEGVAERFKRAAEGGGATPDEVDRAVRQAQADRARFELADARKRASIAGSRSEDVTAARARLQVAEGRVKQARAALEQRIVRAPAAGRILQSRYRNGEFYSPGAGEPLINMGDTRELRARIDVDERDIGQVALGRSAVLRVPALPSLDFTGKVVEIGSRMGRKNVRADDPVERNDSKILEVLVAIDDPGRLVVGQRIVGYIMLDR